LSAAEEIVAYFAEARRLLGALPTQDTIVMERFFDEAGGCNWSSIPRSGPG
jgi:ATP-dependent Lhr-like helicase